MTNPLAARGAVLLVLLLALACTPVPAPAPGSGPAGSAPTYTVYATAGRTGAAYQIDFRPGAGAVVVNALTADRRLVEGEGPHGIAVDSDRHRVYLTTGYGPLTGALRAYAPGPDTPIGREVRLGSFPSTVDITPDGLFAFVTRSSLQGDLVPGGVSVVSTIGMREVARTPTCGMPRGGRIDRSGTRHYSVCAIGDRLVEIDTRTLGVTRTLPLRSAPGRCGAEWVEPSVDGSAVYVACAEGDRIYEIDVVAWRIERTFRTAKGAHRLDATPDGRFLVATLAAASAVQLFDLVNGQPLTRTPVTGGRPLGVVVSPDSRYVFVSVEGLGGRPGRVEVYETERLNRVASVAVGRGAGEIAFWRVQR